MVTPVQTCRCLRMARMPACGLSKMLFTAVAAWLTCCTLIMSHHMISQRMQLADANANSCSKLDGSYTQGFQLPLSRSLRLSTVCAHESCRSAYVRHLQVGSAHPIPAIRHILWRNESVSEYFAEQLRSWQRIHPDWTYVLWRDEDLEPFVETYFPGLLQKFKSLPFQIMRVDMFRYMLLFKFGGIYADLDYKLVRNVDEFRRFHAVVTREPEAHSIHFFGMSWPVKPFANAALMMSAPGHIFYHFVIQQFKTRVPDVREALKFAGPLGLTEFLDDYHSQFPVTNNAMETVYVPPSFSFFPYHNNRLKSSGSLFTSKRFSAARDACNLLQSSNDTKMTQLKQNPHLIEYCKDVNNMDSITDKFQPVFAIHDLHKSGSIYSGEGTQFYTEKLVDIRQAIYNLKFGLDFM